FRSGDVLLFGRETSGVPEKVHAAADARLVIPIREGLRSLNVAMAAAMAVGEAMRQTAAPSPQSIRHRGRDLSEPEKYEAGEGHLTPLGAPPHPHRSLALCRSLPPVKVPTQAEADIAPPTSPTPAGFPETMAKKSFAWNFPRPKQWQKKAWLKFSSTRKRCAYVVHMTRVWFRL